MRIPATAFAARVGGDKNLKKILGALTVVESHSPGRPKFMARKIASAYFYLKEGGVMNLYLPRQKSIALLKAKAISSVSTDADPLPDPRTLTDAACETGTPLYGYQQAAVDYLCSGPLSEERADASAANAYLKMDTGLGKTRVAGGVIVEKKVPTAVVVPTEAIREQWVDELADAYPGLKVAPYTNLPKGSRKVAPTAETHDVVIFIVNTFREKDSSILDGFGMTIFDEAHEYHSPVNRKSLWLAQTRYVWGMSATPEETSARGLDRYVFFHLGAPIPQEVIPDFDISEASFTGHVRKVEYTGHPDHCETATTAVGTASAILTIGNVIKDPARMKLVIAEIDRLLHMHEKPGAAAHGLGPHPDDGHVRRHGVFCFAEHREYLPDVRKALIEHFGKAEVFTPEIDAAADDPPAVPSTSGAVSVLRGGVAKNAVQSARKIGAHIVLTTYGYSRRGISLPDMTSLVKLTPRRNGGIQIIGRILRRGSDQSIVREVVDIVDMRTGLKSQFTDRNKDYKKKGFPVSVVKADWTEYLDGNAEAKAGKAAAPDAADEEDVDEELSLDDLLGAAPADDADAEP